MKEWPEGPGFFGGLWHSVVWCGMIRYGMVWFGTRAWLLSKGDLNPIKEHGKQTMTLCSMENKGSFAEQGGASKEAFMP